MTWRGLAIDDVDIITFKGGTCSRGTRGRIGGGAVTWA